MRSNPSTAAMRDLAVREPRQSVQAKADVDLEFINEGQLDLDKILELIEKVDLPTEKIINPTLTTGKNTRVLVSLLVKLLQQVQSMHEDCQTKFAKSSIELVALHQAFTQGQDHGHEKHARLLNVVLIAELGKSQAYHSYDKIIQTYQSALRSLTQLLFPLLKLQETVGTEIKKNLAHIECLARTYREIDREWSNVRKAYILMQKETFRIGNMENWQGRLQSTNGTIEEMQTVREYRIELGLTV